ncbi:hypothetical protein Tco_0256419 [Tanacetum coccineum]
MDYFEFGPLRYINESVGKKFAFTRDRKVFSTGIDHMLAQINEKKWALFFCLPNKPLERRLKLIHTDIDVHTLSELACRNGLIDLPTGIVIKEGGSLNVGERSKSLLNVRERAAGVDNVGGDKAVSTRASRFVGNQSSNIHISSGCSLTISNSRKLCDQMLVKIDEDTQRDVQVLHDFSNTLNVMQVGCNENEALMQELEQQKFKLGPYKSLEFYKELQSSRKHSHQVPGLTQISSLKSLKLVLERSKEMTGDLVGGKKEMTEMPASAGHVRYITGASLGKTVGGRFCNAT